MKIDTNINRPKPLDMTTKENKQLVADYIKLQEKVNAKYDKLQESLGGTPATHGLDRTGGRLRSFQEEMNNNTLTKGAIIMETRRGEEFLNDKTTTKSGYQEYLRDVQHSLREKGISVRQRDIGKAFQMYDKVAEGDRRFKTRQMKYISVKEIAREIKRGNTDFTDIFNKLQDKYEELAK